MPKPKFVAEFTVAVTAAASENDHALGCGEEGFSKVMVAELFDAVPDVPVTVYCRVSVPVAPTFGV